MNIYEPEKAELASRDVVSRWMTVHMREGKGVPSPYGEHLWLDIRHLGDKHISTKLREVDEICHYFLDRDPRKDLIPVRPTQHYTMSGLRTNKDGACYGLKGLFSAGEAACWDMHGFNRLGGNSLAETIVAGGIIGEAIVRFLQGYETSIKTQYITSVAKEQQARIDALLAGTTGKENVYAVRSDLQDAMMKYCFVFRNGPDLEEGIKVLGDIYERSQNVGLVSSGLGANYELASALKIRGQVRLGLCIATAALNRTESRGSHNREDYTARNDAEWLSRTLAYWPEGADLPTLKYEETTPYFEIPPGDRGYGGGKIIPADEKMVAEKTVKK